MKELEKLASTVNGLTKLLAEMNDLSQPRTKFALAHFVVGQHDLPGRQYQQVLIELQSLLFSLGEMYDTGCELQLDLDDLEALDDGPRKEIAIRRARRRIESLRIEINGRLREVEFLVGLLNRMPKYTLEQLESEEAQYWQRRLSRQHIEARLGDPGNLDAIIQMFTTPGEVKPQLAGVGDVLKMFGDAPIREQLEGAVRVMLPEDTDAKSA